MFLFNLDFFSILNYPYYYKEITNQPFTFKVLFETFEMLSDLH